MKSKRPPPALAPRPAISELAGNQAASIFSNSSISSSGNTIITDHHDSHETPPPGHHNNYPQIPHYPCIPPTHTPARHVHQECKRAQVSHPASHNTPGSHDCTPGCLQPSCPSTDPQSVLPPTPLSQCHSHLGVAWSPFEMLSTKVGMILRVPLACHAAPPWHFSLCWNASNDRKPTTLAIHPFVRKSCSIKSYPN